MAQTGQNFNFELERMPQLSELRTPDDDWTGKTKAEDRRRRQNRLNQRKYRRKRILQRTQGRGISEGTAATPEELAAIVRLHHQGILMLETPEHHVMMYTFLKQVYEDYILKAMKPTYLPALIRLNLLDALGRNATVLGMDVRGLCRYESISPFNSYGPHPITNQLPSPSCPESLHPTPKQFSVKHHPWLDLFPFPQMRNNMIDAVSRDIFDDDELCYDLAYTGDGWDVKKPALIVWGESSDAQAWEVSVEFLKKWGWLLRGCPEIIESTNYWRQKRGEKRLEVVL